MVIDFAVTPGVWPGPPIAPGTVSASAATEHGRNATSFRTESSSL